MYMVVRLGAYEFGTVQRMIDDCMQAANRGLFVLDKKSDDNSAAGENWLSDAAFRLPANRQLLDSSTRVLYRVKRSDWLRWLGLE
jgi:hypothetical protein